jgi:hypothetical protein
MATEFRPRAEAVPMLLSAVRTMWSADVHTNSWSMGCPGLVYCLNRYESTSLLRRSLAHSTAACASYTMCRANATGAAKRAEASCAWRTRVLVAWSKNEPAPRSGSAPLFRAKQPESSQQLPLRYGTCRVNAAPAFAFLD